MSASLDRTTVTLRPATADDLSTWARDPDMGEFFRRQPPAFVQSQLPPYTWVVQGEGGQPIGLVGLHDFDVQARKVAFGILVEKQHRTGPVLLSAVCRVIGDYVFGYLGFHKAYCLTLAHRGKLHATVEGMGFQREATLTDNCFFRGRYWDEVQHSITSERFQELYGDKR